MARVGRGPVASLAIGLLLVSAVPHTSSAQDQGLDALLFALRDTDLGGSDDIDARTIQLYRLPLSVRLRSADTEGWGLRLTFPVSLSAVRLERVTDVGHFVKSLGILAIVPGVEFEFRVGRNGHLKPFVEVGLGRATAGGGFEVLYGGGLSAGAVKTTTPLTVRLGGAVTHRRRPERVATYSRYSTFEGGIDLEVPLGFHIGQSAASAGVFMVARGFDGLEIPRTSGRPLAERGQFEVGISFSTAPELRIWKVRVPWLAVVYQKGSVVSGVRVYSAFPF